MLFDVPLKVDRFDYEAQCRAHSINVFLHDSLNNRRLAGIVEATAANGFVSSISATKREMGIDAQHQDAHLFVFEARFAQHRKHFRPIICSPIVCVCTVNWFESLRRMCV